MQQFIRTGSDQTRLSRLRMLLFATLCLFLVAKEGPTYAEWRGRVPRDMDLDSMMSKLTERLNLTEQQQAEIRSILEEQKQQMNKLREKYGSDRSAMREEAMRLRDQTDERIQPLLTDEQKAKFSQMREKRQQRMRPK